MTDEYGYPQLNATEVAELEAELEKIGREHTLQRTYDVKLEYHGTLMTHDILTLAELLIECPRAAALVEDDYVNEVSYNNQDGEKRTIRRLYT